MGCCTSQVAGAADQPRSCSCVTAGCLRSSQDAGSQSYPSKIKSKTPENGETSPRGSRGSKGGKKGHKASKQESSPCENALAPIVAALNATESALPPIWWHSERAAPPGQPGITTGADSGSDDQSSEKQSKWSSTFKVLNQRPVEEVVDRLLELGVRPWQSIWKHLTRELHVALQRLCSEDAGNPVTPPEEDRLGLEGGAPEDWTAGSDLKEPLSEPLLNASLWDDACRILTSAAAQEITLDQLYSGLSKDAKPPPDSKGGRMDMPSEKTIAALRAAVKVRRRLLRLQEQLAWLARVVATALASEELHEPLVRAVRKELVSAREAGFTSGTRLGSRSVVDLIAWLDNPQATASGESESEKLRQLAHAGFELQGVYFRVVSDSGDWRIACAEIQRARAQGGSGFAAIPGPRLLVAVEGLGLRLLAVPALSTSIDKDVDRVSVDNECVMLASSYLEQLRISPPEDPESLRRWAAGLPNPRRLLSLTEPLKLAVSTAVATGVDEAQSDEHEPKTAQYLALCFGGDASSSASAEELSAAACGSPAVVTAGTEKALMQRVASALQCSLSDLKRHEHAKADASQRQWCSVFGCICEVWYRPAKSESKRASSIWSWRSNSFALLFLGPVVPWFPRATPAAAGESEAASSLSDRIGSARSFLRVELGFPRHPRAVRSTMHAYGIPAHFAAALAEPRLCGRAKAAADLSQADPAGQLLDETLDEVVGADLLAVAAKHVVRVLSTDDPTSIPAVSGARAAEAEGRLLSPLRREMTRVSWKSRDGPNVEATLQQLPNGQVENKKAVYDSASAGGSRTLEEAAAENNVGYSAGTGQGGSSDPLGAIETESPIPPLPPKSLLAGEGQDNASGHPGPVGLVSSVDGRCRCSSFLESEVQHLLTAFEMHPELDRTMHTVANLKTLATCRSGLLHVAFWARLASSSRQLQVLQELKATSWKSGSGGTTSEQNADGATQLPLALVLPEVGKRLLSAVWRAPPTLVRTLCSQLHVELMPSVLRRLRPCTEPALGPLAVRLHEAQATKLPGMRVVQVAYCRAKTAMSLQATIADALGTSADAAMSGLTIAAGDAKIVTGQSVDDEVPTDASKERAAEGRRNSGLVLAAGHLLVGHDLAVHPEWFRCRRISVSTTPRQGDNTASIVENGSGFESATSSRSADSLSAAAATAADQLAEVNASFNVHFSKDGSSLREDSLGVPGIAASLAAAICISRQVQDHSFPQHQVQRARDLLQCAQWLLLSLMREVYSKHGAQLSAMPATQIDDAGSATTKVGTSSGQSSPDGACIARVLTAVMYVLQLVAVLVANLGSCPPELLVGLWTLRGYVWEKRSQIEACFVDYLQALAMIDEEWGDPRKRGGRGHPFALFLSWKLGLISYCRGDGKSIDKFADYFRSLVLQYAACCPFTWGPPANVPGSPWLKGQSVIDEEDISKLLWANESCLWTERGLWSWWKLHDALNCGRECSGLSRNRVPTVSGENVNGVWPRSTSLRQRDVLNHEGSIASDLQEVRRGTIFAFGSNQFGQLGVGRPTMVSAIPGDKAQFSNGFASANSHTPACSGSDLWWCGRPARVMALKECRLRDIACGESHCAAVDIDGQVFAWGTNDCHQVGASRHSADIARGKKADTGEADGQVLHLPVCVNPMNAPAELATSPRVKFIAVACGAQFSLALDKAGMIWAWGCGDGGVLGLGVAGLSGRSAPVMVEALHSATSSAVACGSYHAMALARDGELHAWGRAEGGQLGLSETRIEAHIQEKALDDTCICEPLRVFFRGPSRDPAAVGGDTAANEASVAPTAASLAKESPRSANSDLRGAATATAEDPVRVKQVACGDVHSCALDIAGQVWSWGWGEFGQLGLGFSSSSYEAGLGGRSSKRPTPEAIESKHFEHMRIKSVACGGAFSAAVGEISPGPAASYPGNLFLWGANEVGQCTLPPKKLSEVDVPTRAQGLSHTVIRSIACGASHVVALDTSGRAYSWGAAQYGQLGGSLPLKTFSPPPACEPREAGSAIAHQHQPTLIQSVSRLHIMKAACGLHHTLLVSEVSTEGSAARAAVRNGGDGMGSGRGAGTSGNAGGSSGGTGGLVGPTINVDSVSEGAGSGSGITSGTSANRGGGNGAATAA